MKIMDNISSKGKLIINCVWVVFSIAVFAFAGATGTLIHNISVWDLLFDDSQEIDYIWITLIGYCIISYPAIVMMVVDIIKTTRESLQDADETIPDTIIYEKDTGRIVSQDDNGRGMYKVMLVIMGAAAISFCVIILSFYLAIGFSVYRVGKLIYYAIDVANKNKEHSGGRRVKSKKKQLIVKSKICNDTCYAEYYAKYTKSSLGLEVSDKQLDISACLEISNCSNVLGILHNRNNFSEIEIKLSNKQVIKVFQTKLQFKFNRYTVCYIVVCGNDYDSLDLYKGEHIYIAYKIIDGVHRLFLVYNGETFDEVASEADRCHQNVFCEMLFDINNNSCIFWHNRVSSSGEYKDIITAVKVDALIRYKGEDYMIVSQYETLPGINPETRLLQRIKFCEDGKIKNCGVEDDDVICGVYEIFERLALKQMGKTDKSKKKQHNNGDPATRKRNLIIPIVVTLFLVSISLVTVLKELLL